MKRGRIPNDVTSDVSDASDHENNDADCDYFPEGSGFGGRNHYKTFLELRILGHMPTAVKHLQSAARKGIAEAEFLMAHYSVAVWRGGDKKNDVQIASTLLWKSALKGYVPAVYQLHISGWSRGPYAEKELSALKEDGNILADMLYTMQFNSAKIIRVAENRARYAQMLKEYITRDDIQVDVNAMYYLSLVAKRLLNDTNARMEILSRGAQQGCHKCMVEYVGSAYPCRGLEWFKKCMLDGYTAFGENTKAHFWYKIGQANRMAATMCFLSIHMHCGESVIARLPNEIARMIAEYVYGKHFFGWNGEVDPEYQKTWWWIANGDRRVMAELEPKK